MSALIIIIIFLLFLLWKRSPLCLLVAHCGCWFESQNPQQEGQFSLLLNSMCRWGAWSFYIWICGPVAQKVWGCLWFSDSCFSNRRTLHLRPSKYLSYDYEGLYFSACPSTLSSFLWAWRKMGLPKWLSGKESTCWCRKPGSIPGSGRSPGEGNGKPLRYSCLEKLMDRGAWWATVHGVSKRQTQLSDWQPEQNSQYFCSDLHPEVQSDLWRKDEYLSPGKLSREGEQLFSCVASRSICLHSRRSPPV